MSNNTLKENLDGLYRKLENVPENAGIIKYFDWLNNNLLSDAKLDYSEENEDTPFLSVIMRTQGKRPAALRDVMLSLNAQVDKDFEVILLGHKLDESGLDCVNTILEEQPDDFKSAIRFFEVEDGNRTKPLNVGFENAKGKYISILDDDDIVFDNWVSEFHNAYNTENGKVFYAYAFAQDWELIKTDDGELLRSVSEYKTLHCRDFDYIKQLSINNCPIMGLAFPAFLFKNLGVRFNEALSTVEDWDFLMRAVSILGVYSIDTPTSIYRIWQNAENSKSAQSDNEWKENHDRVQHIICDMTHILHPGSYPFERIALEKFIHFEEIDREYEEMKIDYDFIKYGKAYKLAKGMSNIFHIFKRK